MSAFEQQPVVGLFGTCGPTTFRQDYIIPNLNRANIPHYNPQVADGTWQPWMSDEEADHLAYDVVQTWPVTADTYGGCSLTEQGHSIASSLRADSPYPKFVIPMIEMDLAPYLDDDVARKESIRARKLAVSHLRLNASPNVFVVNTMPEMLDTAIELFTAAEALTNLVRERNPAFQRFMQGRAEREGYRQALESGLLGVSVQQISRR